MAYNIPQEYIFLSTQTATASASLSFTSLISSTYPVYYVKIRNILPATNNVQLLLTFSTDNGATYLASAYGWSFITNATTAGLGSVRSNNLTATSLEITSLLSNTSTRLFNANMWIYNLATTTPVTVKGRSIHYNQSGNLDEQIFNGMNTGTTAVNAIKFAMNSGNITSGTISLYGMTL